MCAKMSSFSPDSLLLPHRVWKVKFVGRRCLTSISPDASFFENDVKRSAKWGSFLLLGCLNHICFPSGESVDDCGGGYSESIAEMCEELQNALTPLLIVTPNGRDESGANRDCFLLNPAAKSPLHMSMFRFLGMIQFISQPGLPGCLSLRSKSQNGKKCIFKLLHWSNTWSELLSIPSSKYVYFGFMGGVVHKAATDDCWFLICL